MGIDAVAQILYAPDCVVKCCGLGDIAVGGVFDVAVLVELFDQRLRTADCF